jgi:hypothetical protein
MVNKNRSNAAKQVWHKRKVKQTYQQICNIIASDGYWRDKVINNQIHQEKLASATNELKKIRIKYTDLAEDIAKNVNMLNALPIESVRDMDEFVKNGRPSKARVGDIKVANDIREQATDIIRNNEQLASDAKIAYIDLIQERIRIILEAVEKENE